MKNITDYFNKLYKNYFKNKDDDFFLIDIKTILTWLLGNNVTEISKYLCKVYTGLDNENTVIWYPVSYGDFARCYEFFNLLSKEDTQKVLNKVSEKNIVWKGIKEHYDELVKLYELGDVHEASKIINSITEQYHKTSNF